MFRVFCRAFSLKPDSSGWMILPDAFRDGTVGFFYARELFHGGQLQPGSRSLGEESERN